MLMNVVFILAKFFQMFSMDIDPMQSTLQRNRRELELHRYPFLANEIIRQSPEFCQQMTDNWKYFVLDPLTKLMVPARLERPVAFDTVGHWGPFAHTDDWGTLRTAKLPTKLACSPG